MLQFLFRQDFDMRLLHQRMRKDYPFKTVHYLQYVRIRVLFDLQFPLYGQNWRFFAYTWKHGPERPRLQVYFTQCWFYLFTHLSVLIMGPIAFRIFLVQAYNLPTHCKITKSAFLFSGWKRESNIPSNSFDAGDKRRRR